MEKKPPISAALMPKSFSTMLCMSVFTYSRNDGAFRLLALLEFLILDNLLNFLENLFVLLIDLDLATPLDHLCFVWSQVFLFLWCRVNFVLLKSVQVMVIWGTRVGRLSLDI